FDCDLMPEGLQIDRQILVDFISTEHRSYANFPATMKDEDGDIEASFDLPELAEKYGKSGLKIGITVHLADNAKGTKKSKTRKAL
ncbi:unnamed protein product, partial [marine sediment metagenome]